MCHLHKHNAQCAMHTHTHLYSHCITGCINTYFIAYPVYQKKSKVWQTCILIVRRVLFKFKFSSDSIDNSFEYWVKLSKHNTKVFNRFYIRSKVLNQWFMLFKSSMMFIARFYGIYELPICIVRILLWNS